MQECGDVSREHLLRSVQCNNVIIIPSTHSPPAGMPLAQAISGPADSLDFVSMIPAHMET